MEKKESNGNNPNRKAAVALSYEPSEQAPKIIASGRGILADKIVQVAEEAKVPIHKDEGLANTLSKLEIGEYIPQELYQVVAEVLIFVDQMENIKGKLKNEQKKNRP